MHFPSLFLLVPLVRAAIEPRGAFCAGACRESLSAVDFTDRQPGESPLGSQYCESRFHIQSLYLCLSLHCDTGYMRSGIEQLNQTCQHIGRALPPFDVISNFTDEKIAKLPRVNTTGSTPGISFDGPVLPSSYIFTRWFHTLDAIGHVHYYHRFYGLSMILFWVLVSFVGIINRAAAYFEIRTSGRFGRRSTPARWLKRNVVTPATFGHRCTQDFGGWCTIPSRIQSLAILLFLGLNIVCSVHGYKIIPDNIYFPTKTKQVLRYVSDRTGIISFANFPLIWLFGMRNNMVIWITGWDFGTFNKFHRWVARIATVQAVVHSVGYTILILKDGGWAYFVWWWTMMFFWTGELATIFMVALLFLSVYWLRRRHYETFLLIHIGISLLILATMLGHVSIFNGQYDAFVWVPAIIWAIDRAMRMGRILWFRSRHRRTNASVIYSPASNILRLEVPISSEKHTFQPGTYYYLMLLSGGKWWESHPFTVASSGFNRGKSSSEDETTALLSEADEVELHTESSDNSHCMTFLIRPYDGFTSRMKELAEEQWPKPATLTLAVDGPYGRSLPLQFFDNVVYIVGGSGIVVPLAYSQCHAQDSQKLPNVTIHWSVREVSFVHDILKKDLDLVSNHTDTKAHIYLTGSEGNSNASNGSLPHVVWNHGRQDVFRSIRQAVDNAGQGSLAIVACGPAAMADEVRRATVRAMRDVTNRIEYFEESFQW